MFLRRTHRWADRPRDLRREMIAETEAFLTWAVERERNVPRLPVRPVEQGGFARLLRSPAARTRVTRFWRDVLDSIG